MKRLDGTVWIAVVALIVLSTAVGARAQLGCSDPSGSGFVFTCSQDADCMPIGGSACTAGLCTCADTDPAFPLCACTPPAREGFNDPSQCSDHIDNDGDMLIDCQDPDCANVPPCVNPAPTMSLPMLGITLLLLAGVGVFGLRRARRSAGV